MDASTHSLVISHKTPRRELIAMARPYCDPKTGRVRRRIPDDLMMVLRRRDLATAIYLSADTPCRYTGALPGGLSS